MGESGYASFAKRVFGVPLHQLIVIGNGFDLECGLKSGFYDFFRPRFEAIDEIAYYDESRWCASVKDAGLTIWDFILHREKDSNWCDIERAIEQVVVKPEGTARYLSWPLTLAVGQIKSSPFAPTGITVTSNGRLAEENTPTKYMLGNISRYTWMSKGAMASRFSEADLLAFLREQLTVLETAFSNYLLTQTASNDDYIKRSKELYDLLYQDSLDSDDLGSTWTTVLDFNYTYPFGGAGFFMRDTDVVNIHGRVGGEIVFGIDGKDCMSDSGAMPYTKTYRVVSMGTRVPSQVFHDGSSNADSATKYIKFYGHSLAEPDYSYFQSIFDGVNLYGGNTTLVFYYRPKLVGGVRTGEEAARTSMVNKVAKLLYTYGTTMDNVNHGQNLMHKLLLEGRLQVQRI